MDKLAKDKVSFFVAISERNTLDFSLVWMFLWSKFKQRKEKKKQNNQKKSQNWSFTIQIEEKILPTCL